MMLSGEKVLLHYYYAGVSAPKPGYARLVWKDGDETQLTGICFNKRDAERLDSALDDPDCDDTLSLIFMQDEEGKNPQVLILRLPMSQDGGAVLKLNREDQKKLRELDYHFYRKAGGHRYPDLHHIGEDGKAAHPDVLFAEEIPQAKRPAWTAKEEEAINSMMGLKQFKGCVGKVANLTSALDISGLWQPEEAKVNLSAEVVDPAMNADKNPEALVEQLIKLTYRKVEAGEPFEATVVDRIERMILKHHMELGNEEPLSVRTKLSDHSKRLAQGLSKASKDILGWNLAVRQISANGPAHWLTKEFDPEITAEVIEAKAARDRAWEAKRENDKRVRANRNLSESKRNSLLAVNAETVRIKEREAVAKAYERVKNHPEYAPGCLRAIWPQLSIAAGSRTKNPKPVAIYGLAVMPPMEHMAYYGTEGEPCPTVIVRPKERVELAPGTEARIRYVKRGTYILADSNGEEITRVGTEAKHFMSWNQRSQEYKEVKAKVHGYMADPDPGNLVTIQGDFLILERGTRK